MEPKCNHVYTLKTGKVFRCDKSPHPHRPAEHYYVRDLELEAKRAAQPRIRPLHTVPGQRR